MSAVTRTLVAFLLLGLAGFARGLEVESPLAPVIFSTSTVKPWGMPYLQNVSGVLDETVAALMKETGEPYQNLYRPYSRVFHDLYSGEVDMALVFDSPEVNDRAIRIDIVTPTRVVVLGRVGQPAMQSLDQLYGMRVGYIRGSKYGSEFDNGLHFEHHPMNTMRQGLAMLLGGRLDAMTAVDHTVYWGLREMNVGTDKVVELLDFPGPNLALFVSKKSPRKDQLSKYRKAIEELRRSGEIERIFGDARRWAKSVQP